MPLLMVIMLSLLAVGVLFFQVGRAAIFSTEAQTAADAAALGGRPEHQGAADGAGGGARARRSSRGARPRAIKAAAEEYARKNGGHVSSSSAAAWT